MIFLKKWLGFLISLPILLVITYCFLLPVIIMGYIIVIINNHNYPTFTHILLIIVNILPIILLILAIYLQLNGDPIKIAMEEIELMNEDKIKNNQELVFLYNKKYLDPINQRLVDALNKAKEKLNISKNINLIRVKDYNIVNAFSVSNLKGSVIVVFDGLVANIENEEILQAIIGHELGHIKNNDFITTINLYIVHLFTNWSQKMNGYVRSLIKKIPFLSFPLLFLIDGYEISNVIVLFIGSSIIEFINIYFSIETVYLADKAAIKASSKESVLTLLKSFKIFEEENEKSSVYSHPFIEKRIEFINKL
jgi:Zn-dependent protease with chaperone function